MNFKTSKEDHTASLSVPNEIGGGLSSIANWGSGNGGGLGSGTTFGWQQSAVKHGLSSQSGWAAGSTAADNATSLSKNHTIKQSLEGVSLQSFLEGLGLSKHLSVFQNEELDMEALKLMTEDDFKEIGIPKGPRVKIIHRLRRPM